MPGRLLSALFSARYTVAALSRSCALVAFTPDLQVIHANRNFRTLLGCQAEEDLAGTPHTAFCEPDLVASEEYRRFRARLARGEFVSGRVRRRRRDGTRIWLEASYNPILDRHGRVTRIVKLASDVTAQVEEAAVDGRRLAALDRSMAVIDFDLEGRILAANDNFLALAGYRRDQLIGAHHRRLCTAEYAAGDDYARFWERLNQGEFFSGQFERVRADGGPLWLEATYNPVYDGEGRLTGVVKFASDITERVRRQQAESEGVAVAFETSSSTLSASRRGGERIESTLQEMRDMATVIEDASRRFADLRAGTESITGLVEAIQRIAEQTNLLALNAAIESARAGEHGRGFAVVAHEVRLLAERTGTATRDITGAIESLRTLTGEADGDLLRCQENVSASMSLAGETGALIGQVEEGARRVVDAVENLSARFDRARDAA